MTSLIEQLFDPDISAADLDPSSVNPAQVRTPLLARLAADELPGDRVGAAIVALRGSARRSVDALRSMIAADLPPTNRAVATGLLLAEDLDPGTPADRLPALLESVLIAAAVAENLRGAAVLLAAVLSAPTDGAAILRRVDPWRLALAVPGHALYGPALADRACAPHHAAILALLERDPLADQAIRAAVASGALDPTLASAAHAPGPSAPLSGRAFIRPRCARCGGFQIEATVHVEGPGRSVLVSVHLSPTGSEGGAVVVLASAGSLRAREDAVDADADLFEVPLDAVGASARQASAQPPADETTERALWLLRQVPPGDRDLEQVLADDLAADLSAIRALCVELADLEEDGPRLMEAAHVLRAASADGAFEAGATPRGDLAVYLSALDATLGALERVRWRWGQPSTAGHRIWPALRLGLDAEALRPEVVTLLTDDRRERLDWQTTVAFSSVCSADDAEERRATLVGWTTLLDRRPRHTPRAVLEALGGPPEALATVAGWFGVGPDEPIGSADRF